MLICKVPGSRGRRIDVYDNKCVITTDVSLGSVLTSNALDGQKTLFYIDIVGVQFKKSGLTIGYLQFETASLQMNNMSSNMFSENTYTYEHITSGISNELIQKLHDYIVNQIESIKYNTPPQKEYLHDLVAILKDSRNCYIDVSALQQVTLDKQNEKRLKEEKLIREAQQQQEAHTLAVAEYQKALQNKGLSEQLETFLSHAIKCGRIQEVQNLWNSYSWEKSFLVSEIDKKLSQATQIERMYGYNPNSLQKLMEDIKEMVLLGNS